MNKEGNIIESRVCQGDIFRNVEYVEYALEKKGVFEISKIRFPFVIVLTQDCDLEQDFKSRANVINHDKHLISVIVAPLYNFEHVCNGEHLGLLGLDMQKIKKTKSQGKYLTSNQLARYHYLTFEPDVPIPDSVIDFKHYFSVNIEVLLNSREQNFVVKTPPLYRENISQRFASFLSRIGLPSFDQSLNKENK